jgi:hypothetical protein
MGQILKKHLNGLKIDNQVNVLSNHLRLKKSRACSAAEGQKNDNAHAAAQPRRGMSTDAKSAACAKWVYIPAALSNCSSSVDPVNAVTEDAPP